MIAGILGAAGSIVGGAMNAAAQKKVAKIQAKAIKDARDFLFKNLDPAVVSKLAAEQDIARAQQRLAFQEQIDPELAQQRKVSQELLSQQLAGIGQGPAQDVAALATEEAMTGSSGFTDLKNRMIDAALTELNAGATLPPDVQAELVQAGLEKSGMVSGAASPRGLGGNILRKEIGQGALKLQADRQARAMALSGAASQLDAQRQSMLQSLFPNLQAMQAKDIAMTSGILQQSNALVPEVGLGGADIAELWKARVGAYAQGTQDLGLAKSAGTKNQTSAIADLIGKIGAAGDQYAPLLWGRKPDPSASRMIDSLGSWK
jgi:hypothetical protein